MMTIHRMMLKTHLLRTGEVRWIPCLRTFKEPQLRQGVSVLEVLAAEAAAVQEIGDAAGLRHIS